jgi:hypothetical protein
MKNEKRKYTVWNNVTLTRHDYDEKTICKFTKPYNVIHMAVGEVQEDDCYTLTRTA